MLVVSVVGAVGWWTFGAYGPGPRAEEAVSGARDEGGWYEFGGDGGVGVVVYPGARVDAEAYAATALELRDLTGATVAVARVPLEFALADGDAADEIIAAHPEVEQWIVAGHSLGGVAAAGYAEDHPRRVDGLLLWASYPAGSADLSGDDIKVESIYGSRDGVLDPRSLDEAKGRLPRDAKYVEVEGMNHAQFGDYGAQSGDGEARIPDEEARREVVDASEDLVSRLRR